LRNGNHRPGTCRPDVLRVSKPVTGCRDSRSVEIAFVSDSARLVLGFVTNCPSHVSTADRSSSSNRTRVPRIPSLRSRVVIGLVDGGDHSMVGSHMPDKVDRASNTILGLSTRQFRNLPSHPMRRPEEKLEKPF
jgi:hypothetical protein